MHQPRHPEIAAGGDDHPGAGDVGPQELRPGATEADLGGEVDHGVLTRDGTPYGAAIADVGQHLGQAERRGMPLEDRDPVAPGRELSGDRGAEHAATPGEQDLHGRRRPAVRPPARRRSAQRATRARSIFDACRMSTGSRSVTSTAASGVPAAVRTSAAEVGRGERPAGRRVDRHDHGDALLGARGSDPDQRGHRHRSEHLDPLLDPHRGDRAVGTADHVHEPTFDPEPTLVVEVADVAGPVPARRRRAAPLGGPEPVVVVLDVLSGQADLAGHARVVDELSDGIGGGRCEGVDPDASRRAAAGRRRRRSRAVRRRRGPARSRSA